VRSKREGHRPAQAQCSLTGVMSTSDELTI
jgi:hypothetical protein